MNRSTTACTRPERKWSSPPTSPWPHGPLSARTGGDEPLGQPPAWCALAGRRESGHRQVAMGGVVVGPHATTEPHQHEAENHRGSTDLAVLHADPVAFTVDLVHRRRETPHRRSRGRGRRKWTGEEETGGEKPVGPAGALLAARRTSGRPLRRRRRQGAALGGGAAEQRGCRPSRPPGSDAGAFFSEEMFHITCRTI